jgi:hypothetical protein
MNCSGTGGFLLSGTKLATDDPAPLAAALAAQSRAAAAHSREGGAAGRRPQEGPAAASELGDTVGGELCTAGPRNSMRSCVGIAWLPVQAWLGRRWETCVGVVCRVCFASSAMQAGGRGGKGRGRGGRGRGRGELGGDGAGRGGKRQGEDATGESPAGKRQAT